MRDEPAAQRPSTPLATLRELHRAGDLTKHYADVPRLLAELEGKDRAAAGRLLARLDPDEVRRAHPEAPTVTVAITGHGTLSELVPALTAELARHGLLARIRVSDFDSYVFDLSDPDSALYAYDPDLTLCVLDPWIVLDALPLPWTAADAADLLEEKLTLLERMVFRHEDTARGTLVLNTLPLPRLVTAQQVDRTSRARVAAAWHEANARLLRLAPDHPRLTVFDVSPWLAAGVPATDPRLSGYAKAHLSTEMLAEYARDVGHLARQVTGATKKVLAVDLDQTLWGGVLGDEGPDGVEVAETPRGEAFQGFQRVIAQLASQGVLLAAVSKNDIEPVRELLRTHPGMTLREDHFVRVVANWAPKHDNLRQLAADLNLGVDSVVFVDDSPFECGLVRHELPRVAVVPLDTEPTLHAEKLLHDGWFDVRSVTTEDRRRPTLYREELTRKDFLATFESADDYLRNLDVTVRLGEVTEQQVPRVSQITMRTNQFNLTTERLGEPDVRRLADAPNARVLTIHAADRFGDNGLVGAVFTRRDQDTTHIDNFLLSCRVFSRGIEQTCLAAVLRQARADGAAAVEARYRRSAKNGKVSGFYPRAGFSQVTDDGTTTVFRHDLATLPEPAPHVRLRNELNGSESTP
ncbi:HAD-IIIC family phosphatase [Streptomyces mayteni]